MDMVLNFIGINLSRILIVSFSSKTISFRYMAHYRLSRSVDGKTLTWTWLNSIPTLCWHYCRNNLIVTIDTWKGSYKIDMSWQNSNLCGQGLTALFDGTKSTIHIWIISCDYATCKQKGVYLHHPIQKQWIPVDNKTNTLYELHDSIVHDIEQWILDQPPKLDQFKKAYEEDRVSVEHTFVEIENSKK